MAPNAGFADPSILPEPGRKCRQLRIVFPVLCEEVADRALVDQEENELLDLLEET